MRNPFLKGSSFKGSLFNEYLREVEKKEYAQKRRMLILLAGLIASILVVGFIYLTSSPTPLEGEPIPFDRQELKVNQTLISQRSIEPESQKDESFCLDPIICVVEGEFAQHKPIYFHIANYNGENTYVIEYGDGNQQRIPEKHAFVFNTPGEYQIKITAFNPTYNRHIKTTRTLYIKSSSLKRGEHHRDTHC